MSSAEKRKQSNLTKINNYFGEKLMQNEELKIQQDKYFWKTE